MTRQAMHKLQRVTIASEQLVAGRVVLTADQLHYLQRVLRLSPGAQFVVTTGRGRAWLARLGDTGSTACLQEEMTQHNELPVAVTAIVALPKGSGFDDIVRAGTELGAAAFVPVLSARTLLKPAPSRLARWRRIATEAAEQSEREYVPEIAEPILWEDAIARPDLRAAGIQRYICVARHGGPHLGRLARDTGPIAIATGCEGGWTEAELAAAITAGFVPVTLGKRILRAVTAPLAALAALAVALERED